MSILITGAAGFIGFHLCSRLIKKGVNIVGFDNLNNYYDVKLKKARLLELKKISNEKNNFYFFKENLENFKELSKIFEKYKPQKVVHLAAQAGVRYSLENPSAYIQSNVVGFGNILELCKLNNVKNLIFASSSSVYGGNIKMPFRESHGVNHPISLYAATKKSNELMAHTYSHLYDLPCTGLRFFTVYGPWGRPDMALFLFTKKIFNDEPIKVFNNGKMMRDFTYIDDICESLLKLLDKPATKSSDYKKENPDPSKSWAPFRVFNIGNSNPTKLMDYIRVIEENIGKKAKIEFTDMQPGDVKQTFSDCAELEKWIKFKPNTSIEYGVKEFVSWYKDFYHS